VRKRRLNLKHRNRTHCVLDKKVPVHRIHMVTATTRRIKRNRHPTTRPRLHLAVTRLPNIINNTKQARVSSAARTAGQTRNRRRRIRTCRRQISCRKYQQCRHRHQNYGINTIGRPPHPATIRPTDKIIITDQEVTPEVPEVVVTIATSRLVTIHARVMRIIAYHRSTNSMTRTTATATTLTSTVTIRRTLITRKIPAY